MTRSSPRPTPRTRPRVPWTTLPGRSASASGPRAFWPSARYGRCAMPDTARSVAIVTAAGSAERFGGKKLLASVDGEPLLERSIRSLLGGGVHEVIVVIGADARVELERDVKALRDGRVRAIENPDPSRGMFSSIQEGARTADGDV